MRSREIVLSCLLLSGACASDDADSAAAPDPGPLCDGSQDVRWGYTLSGGSQKARSGAFETRYGWNFAFVRGDCHYFVSKAPGLIREGMLASERAAMIEQDVRFDRIADFSTFEDYNACPDAGEDAVHAPGGSVACVCGCDPRPADALREAFIGAASTLESLWMTGEPSDGSVAAAVEELFGLDPESAVDWPLALELSELAQTHFEGMRFDDPDDAAALRALGDVGMSEPFRPIAVVRDSAGKLYALYLRDELPIDAAAAADEFRDRTVHF